MKLISDMLRAQIQNNDFTPMPTPAERQRQRRAWLKEKGYRRIELTLSPKLLRGLMPHILEYGGDTYTGLAISQLLEDCIRSWNEPE